MEAEYKARFPWWYWIWLGHLLFVGFMYRYMYMPGKSDWYKTVFSAINLAQEQNYAVWWSALCLFFAASLFYRAASQETGLFRSWRWITLSLVFLALGADEIGSLHEMVSNHYGWLGLVPFALLFGAGVGAALYSMVKTSDYRVAASLIFMGIALFAAVASLEFVEHNMEMTKTAQKRRLIFEESAELFAISLIVIAGLIIIRKLGVRDRTLSGLIGNPKNLWFHEHVVFAMFALNFLLIAGFVIPNAGKFSEGNPSGVFPIFLYFVLSMMCIRVGRSDHGEKNIWWGFALLFLFTSLCQIHSFTVLMQKLLFDFPWFSSPPDTWLITLAPLALLCWFFLSRRWTTVLQMVPHFLLFVPIAALLYADRHSSMAFYLFSGCTAYLCYRLMAKRISAMGPYF